MNDLATESRIIKPNEASGIVVPAVPYKERESWGAIQKHDILPWKGVWFAVVAIASRNNHDVLVTLKPMKVTSGAVKKMNGKKGKKNARRV